jgi:hypothetical protein
MYLSVYQKSLVRPIQGPQPEWEIYMRKQYPYHKYKLSVSQ